jgi:hypothetical protein
LSGVVDVGDAFELTYTSIAGALVTYDWLDQYQAPVISQEIVPPKAGEPTKYPVTLVPTAPGMWTARFFNAGQTEDYFVRATTTVGQPPPLAAIGDVEIRYGDLDDDQHQLTGYLLKAASKMVRQRFPLIGEQMAAGLLDQDVIAQTVAGMVLRVLWNPEGLKSETTGPFSRTYDTSAAAGLLVVTGDDAQAFVPPDSGATAKTKFPVAGTIRVQPGMAPPVRTIRTWGGYGSW